MACERLSLPKNAVWRKGCWWVKSKRRFRKCCNYGKCLRCGTTLIRIKSRRVYSFCSRKCKAVYLQQGKKSNNWKGGRKIDVHGYVFVYLPEHPNSDQNGYIGEHRYVISQKIKRPLRSDEHVHHINGNRQDNCLENLVLMSVGEHVSLHRKGCEVSAGTRKKLSEWQKSHPQKRDLLTGQFTGVYL